MVVPSTRSTNVNPPQRWPGGQAGREGLQKHLQITADDDTSRAPTPGTLGGSGDPRRAGWHPDIFLASRPIWSPTVMITSAQHPNVSLKCPVPHVSVRQRIAGLSVCLAVCAVGHLHHLQTVHMQNHNMIATISSLLKVRG